MNSGERLIAAQSRMDRAEEQMEQARAVMKYAQEDVIAGAITYSNYKKHCDYCYRRASELHQARRVYWQAYDVYHNEEI